jgi:hypothetical protein
MHIENRFCFAKEFLSRNESAVIYIDETVYEREAREKVEMVHFALGVSNACRIVHWKLKNTPFKPEEIVAFLEETNSKLPGHTILLDNA